MKRIYICAPYRGDIKANTADAIRYARFAIKEGYQPFAPHLAYAGLLDDEKDRELAMQFCLMEVNFSEELWVCGERITDGMTQEIDHAASTAVRIVYVGALAGRP
jgi:hypothetical protein